MAQLVLWDIDHTLVETRGAGRALWAEAFRQVSGMEMREQVRIDGLTEPVIFRRTAELHGLATNHADFEAFAQALGEAHIRHAAALRERGRALDGAAQALEELASRGLHQTVVTGNIRAAAEIKLTTFGLDRHLDLPVGAYAEDAEERGALVSLAVKRAGRQPAEAVLVGDTPADMQAGLTAGVRTVGVATGRSSTDDLHDAGACAVLSDLSDRRAVLQALASAL
ncbi:phosphoglycolate phosphatase [Streptomyces sp. WAC 06783]|uniref:HAD family hydrolase n=1 Tax=Streptomyces sp. WAC 06783 TaxID=2203211 RepID=UPI000F749DFE|nr:HAD family hydrolase [Streptomyces sp. WAC 06783]RSO07040.1 phosphoglycolate phosphatase [Streptomyces sp. WAC 06783]